MHDILTNFNLAVSLRTLPIGVPSLMVSKSSYLNPIANQLHSALIQAPTFSSPGCYLSWWDISWAIYIF